MRSALLALTAVIFASACADDPAPFAPMPPPVATTEPDEEHFTGIVQLTFHGDSRTTRWAPTGDAVLLATRLDGCDRLFRSKPLPEKPDPEPLGAGRDPSFLPNGKGIVYATASKCPKEPEGGGVFLDPDLDIFRAASDGSSPKQLTNSPGYDGEPAACPKDGSIVFTSTRDGDPDLYRMDADGGNVRRVTATDGYDGQAAFDADCSHIVWRAARPIGADVAEFKRLLAQNVLRPRSTELWVANADGSDARQITYLASHISGPTWMPRQERVVFASDYGGKSARDVDVWAVDANGTSLERITTAAGFDGYPAFSPDGRLLAFSSVRATTLGDNDRNVFVTRWSGAWRHVEERPADHLMGDAGWLAAPAREGRGLGTKGLDDAGAYVERSFRSFGISPGNGDDFRQDFDVTTDVTGQVSISIAGAPIDPSQMRPLGFSASASVDGPLLFVGAESDYARVGATGKIVVVRAITAGGMRRAAAVAHQHGAVGILGVSEGALTAAAPDSDEGIPAAMVSSAAMAPFLSRLVRGQHPQATLAITLAPTGAHAFNVVGRWPSSVPDAQKLPGVVVVGAHYDHIGPKSPGADDNASGVAALLQIGRSLSSQKAALRRDVLLVAFSGEEQGAAGALAFVKHPPGTLTVKEVTAMINLDMVGRLRDNTLQVVGTETSPQWPDLLQGSCDAAGIRCAPATATGLGALDHTAFYDAGVPVLHLFTGVHGDYDRATDTMDTLNAAGMAEVAHVAEQIVRDLTDLSGRLDYKPNALSVGSAPEFRVSLGTIPDRNAPKGQHGMLLAGVRPGGPADKAGLKKGDLVVRIDGHVVENAEDVMYVLTDAKAGTVVKITVLRNGKEVPFDVTLEEQAPRK